jgi:hypothetical protein
MVMDGSLFVALSFADTLTMPTVRSMSESPVSSHVSRRTNINVERDLDLRNTLRRGRVLTN